MTHDFLQNPSLHQSMDLIFLEDFRMHCQPFPIYRTPLDLVGDRVGRNLDIIKKKLVQGLGDILGLENSFPNFQQMKHLLLGILDLASVQTHVMDPPPGHWNPGCRSAHLLKADIEACLLKCRHDLLVVALMFLPMVGDANYLVLGSE